MLRLQQLRILMRLSWHQRWLLVEAQTLLLMARLALVSLPFRVLAGWLNRPVAARPMPLARRLQHIHDVRWAIAICAKAGVFAAVCFPQGIAARIMLARRGLVPTLYYGVTRGDGRGMQAHVWVKAGNIPVTGTVQAAGYTVLQIFPGAGGCKSQ